MDRCPNQYNPYEEQSSYQPWAPEQCNDQQEFGQNQYYQPYDQQHGSSMGCGMDDDFQQCDVSYLGQNSGGNWNQNQQRDWNNTHHANWGNDQNRQGKWSNNQQGQGWQEHQPQNWNMNSNSQGQGFNQNQGSYNQPWTQNSRPQYQQQGNQGYWDYQCPSADQTQNCGYSNGNDYGQEESYLNRQNPGYGGGQQYQYQQQNQPPPYQYQQQQGNQSQYDHSSSQPQAELENYGIDSPYTEEKRVVEVIGELSERVFIARAEKVLTHQFDDWFERTGALAGELTDAMVRVGAIIQWCARGEYKTSMTLTEWVHRQTKLIGVCEDLA